MCDSKNFMEKAIDISRQKMNENKGGPFGAVIVQKGMVVGRGWNKVTSTNDPTAHAEISAIRDACVQLKTFNLSGCEMYTSCEPCPMCLGAIYWARISKIWYANTAQDAAIVAGFDDEDFYQEFSKSTTERRIPSVQIEREKAIKVFEEWREKENKIRY
jgi:tRNA(Arg) A34 adenosine deaminase TadA